jgi:CRP-like cAMP-binding protein
MTEDEKDEQFYRDTESVAHAKLDDRQLAMLEPLGSRRKVRRGELIFKAGQRDLPLVVIIRGEVEVFEARDGQEQIIVKTNEPRSANTIRLHRVLRVAPEKVHRAFLDVGRSAMR